MELVQLRYFQLLATNQHLIKTANELHITPPALSVSIAKLEAELGAKLFDRVGRNIVLNAYGKTLIPYVNQVFQELHSAQLAIRELQNKQANTVSVFIRDPAFYHKDFQSFYKNNPDIDFRQMGGEMPPHTDLFYEHGLDFIITPRDLRDQGDVEHAELYRDRFLLAVPEGHPLCNRQEVSLSELRNEKFIGHSHSSFFQEQVELLCNQHNFSPRYALRCDYIMRAEMLAKGMGIAITTLHSSTTGYFDGARFLTITELRDELYIFYIYWKKRAVLSDAAQRFKRYLDELYEHMR